MLNEANRPTVVKFADIDIFAGSVTTKTATFYINNCIAFPS